MIENKNQFIINLIIINIILLIELFIFKMIFLTYIYIPIMIVFTIIKIFQNKKNIIYFCFPIILYFIISIYQYHINEYLIKQTKNEIFVINFDYSKKLKYNNTLSNNKSIKKIFGYSIFYKSIKNNVYIETELFDKYIFKYNFLNKEEEIKDNFL